MTDRELLERFEDGTLPSESFHHEEHIRVAFLYLSEHSVLDSLERFSAALRRFATRNGKAGLYLETITCAYILLIRERMARAEQEWRIGDGHVRHPVHQRDTDGGHFEGAEADGLRDVLLVAHLRIGEDLHLDRAELLR